MLGCPVHTVELFKHSLRLNTCKDTLLWWDIYDVTAIQSKSGKIFIMEFLCHVCGHLTAGK